MPKIINLYACEICEAEYRNKQDAVKCESQGRPKPIVKVGDIVFVKSGYRWFDGDRKWVSNPEVLGKAKNAAHGNCFGDCCTMSFYYVVTAIDRDSHKGSHKVRYHVFTKAMTGKDGHHCGYTFDAHYNLEKVKNPPKYIVETSKGLIGSKANYLL